MEDLFAFNEEIVARQIFSSQTPIVTGIGHEPDFTIADFVADRRASTPTAAAELCVFSYEEFSEELSERKRELSRALLEKLSRRRSDLSSYEQQIEKGSPVRRIKALYEKASEAETRIERNFSSKLRETRNSLSFAASRLDALSPIKRLSSGYSYIRDSKGNNIKEAKLLKKDDEIDIRLYKGRLLARVLESVTE